MYMKIVFFLVAFFILKKTDQKCEEKKFNYWKSLCNNEKNKAN